ncbi:hypothetical protein [Mycobacterium neumannii]|uniref:hypothetical protein n=1 Tax=Mycobacterium neumannii TaxID=2048551 RepID=UPI003AB3DB8D
MQRLIGFALDDDADMPPAVALAAIRDALDRAGLNPKTAVEVEVGPTPAFQQLFTGIDRSVRRDGTRVPEQPAPALPAPEILDAEIVLDTPARDGPETRPERPRTPTTPGSATPGRPETAEGRTAPHRQSPWTGPPPDSPAARRPGTELQTMEQAAAELARERRRGRA